MEATTTKTDNQKLWKDINQMIKDQLPQNNTLDDVDIDNLLTVMNYKVGIETQEKIDIIIEDIKSMKSVLKSIKDDIKSMKGNIKLIIKFLSDTK